MNIDVVVAIIFSILGISWLYYYARLKWAEKVGRKLEERLRQRDARN